MALTTLKDRVLAATAEKNETPAPARVSLVRQARDETAAETSGPAEYTEDGTDLGPVTAWLERYRDRFTEALPAHIEARTFLAAVRAALPSLTRCTPASLLQALLTCARFGLVPDGRHAVIAARGPQAVFIPMAQGYVELMYRSGRVGSVHVGTIHSGDEWSFEPTAPAPLDFVHKPRVELSEAQRGEPILAYAFCWLASGARSQVILLNRHDAEEIRDEYSEAYQRAEQSGARDSFWHTDFRAMWAKSALRRLHKVVPMSAELIALGKADDAGEAGQVQIVHAPDDAQLREDADAAHRAAEGSQEQPINGGPERKTQQRKQPQRLSRKARRTKGRR